MNISRKLKYTITSHFRDGSQSVSLRDDFTAAIRVARDDVKRPTCRHAVITKTEDGSIVHTSYPEAPTLL